jgi:hypothetical protein
MNVIKDVTLTPATIDSGDRLKATIEYVASEDSTIFITPSPGYTLSHRSAEAPAGAHIVDGELIVSGPAGSCELTFDLDGSRLTEILTVKSKPAAGAGVAGVAVLAVAAFLGLAGCDEAPLAGPTVSVEKLDPSGACYVPCEGTALPPADLPASCGGSLTVACGLVGGVDRMRVVVDYGVRFSDSAAVPAPTLRFLFDGEELPSSYDMTKTVRDDGRILASRELTVPARVATSVQLVVSASETYEATVSDLTVSAVPARFSLVGCAVSPCDRAANVGTLPVYVETAQDDPRTQAVVTTWLNGVSQPDVTTVDLAAVGGGVRAATAYLPVPDHSGALWTIGARLGDFALPSQDVRLNTPALTLGVQNCDAPSGRCALGAGTTAVVVVTAPLEIFAHQATITSILNGVREIDGVPVDLSEVVGPSRVGVLALKVPGAAGDTWQLRATVGNALPIMTAPIAVGP